MFDTDRDVTNVMSRQLKADTSDAENNNALQLIDFTSNGFKFRSTNGGYNGSASSYIFLAFAESPFKHSNAR